MESVLLINVWTQLDHKNNCNKNNNCTIDMYITNAHLCYLTKATEYNFEF